MISYLSCVGFDVYTFYTDLQFYRIPLLISTLLLALDKQDTSTIKEGNPNFVYGLAEAIVTVSLLVLCFIGKTSTIAEVI